MRLFPTLLASAALLGLSGACSASFAQPSVPSSAQAAQQQRMKDCNTTAKTRSLAGDGRKQFMSACLSGKADSVQSAAAPATQQDRMRSCNAEAGTKKLAGDQRRSFMSACLSGH